MQNNFEEYHGNFLLISYLKLFYREKFFKINAFQDILDLINVNVKE
jgi:hypothetical protein